MPQVNLRYFKAQSSLDTFGFHSVSSFVMPFVHTNALKYRVGFTINKALFCLCYGSGWHWSAGGGGGLDVFNTLWSNDKGGLGTVKLLERAIVTGSCILVRSLFLRYCCYIMSDWIFRKSGERMYSKPKLIFGFPEKKCIAMNLIKIICLANPEKLLTLHLIILWNIYKILIL